MVRLRRSVFLRALLIAAAAAAAVHAAQQPAEEITLRIIVVSTMPEAQRVVEQLENGESFVALAQRVSLDPSARNGGLLGRVALSALRPELRQAVQGLQAGQLGPIVQIPTGFAVLRVVPPADDAGVAGSTPSTANRAVDASGAVRFVADVSGAAEATVALLDFDKPPDWNLDPQMICQVRTQSLAAAQRVVEGQLASGALVASTAPFDLVQTHVLLGQMHAFDGRMEESVKWFGTAYEMAATRAPAVGPSLEEALGVAHLHKAVMDNDVHRSPGDRCLLSPKPQPAWARLADVEKAIAYFSTYLAQRPDDLEVRWLLNVAHMGAGTYPGKVPPALLIPPAAFESAEDVGRFVDVAPRAGLSWFGAAGGVIVDDFDNDGAFDVVTSSSASCDAMGFFRRTEGGLFANQAAARGLAGQVGGLNIMQADYNNDGRLDVLVLRGGWDAAQRRSLLRNNADGTFTDVTAAAGLARPATSSQTAAWTDIDHDGFLDLFVGNENAPAQLFLNKRDGTFEEIGAKAGVNRTAFTKGVAAADYDNDGWPDLFVSNVGSDNFLFRNNRDGTFTELAAAAGVSGVGQGFATWFFDYDNDGWSDLFSASYITSLDETTRTYLRLPLNGATLKLYRNLKDGSFQDVSRQAGLDKVLMPMGANFGDIDNDGFLDIYLGTGNPSYASIVPSVLLRNRDGRSFVDVTSSSGTGELHKGHGVAFADLDGDGDEEIVFEVGGATPGDRHALRLFENPGHGNDWLALKLVGVTTNRAAVGARITVTVEGADGVRRQVHRTVGSGGSFGASPLEQHIGLGRAARTVGVDVYWPTSRTRQRFEGIAPNQVLQITELAGEYAPLRRAPRPLTR